MDFLRTLLGTMGDVAPIVVLLVFFQLAVLRQPIPHLPRVLLGGIYVVLGLSLFLLGLEKALFPLGKIMATQLSSPDFVGGEGAELSDWTRYYWVYIFAALVGFSTSIAEPSVIAVALKAQEVSAGTISQRGLRLTVAMGVSVALALGTYRIVAGHSLTAFILVGYLVVTVQTILAPKSMVPLAYDSGGVTTSTVTVPLVAALGLGLSSVVPGRDPAIDGFGLIAIACLFPIISVLGYAQIADLKFKLYNKKRKKDEVQTDDGSGQA